MPNTCRTCTHWTDVEHDWGICDLLSCPTASTAEQTGANATERLETREDFGCNKHEDAE